MIPYQLRQKASSIVKKLAEKATTFPPDYAKLEEEAYKTVKLLPLDHYITDFQVMQYAMPSDGSKTTARDVATQAARRLLIAAIDEAILDQKARDNWRKNDWDTVLDAAEQVGLSPNWRPTGDFIFLHDAYNQLRRFANNVYSYMIGLSTLPEDKKTQLLQTVLDSKLISIGLPINDTDWGEFYEQLDGLCIALLHYIDEYADDTLYTSLAWQQVTRRFDEIKEFKLTKSNYREFQTMLSKTITAIEEFKLGEKNEKS